MDREQGKESRAERIARVGELIDAICVPRGGEETLALCRQAREAWDALSMQEQRQVRGRSGDWRFFGQDTGDAAPDDPLCGDEIGEREILVVSFGTSFNESRTEDIGGIERAVQRAFPDWSVRRAFTSQIILNHILARDGEQIDSVAQALERAVRCGVRELVVLPTHLMPGTEYDLLLQELSAFRHHFARLAVAGPLLGSVDEPDDPDKRAVAELVVREVLSQAGYESAAKAQARGSALVLMGHGTSHRARVTYLQMQRQMDLLGYANVFVGTVEGDPAETRMEVMREAAHAAGYTQVVLAPLMVVAGDHAHNDMAAEEDSWRSDFESSGYFTSVSCVLAGLGRLPGVQEICVRHAREAMEAGDGAGTVPVLVSSSDFPASFVSSGSLTSAVSSVSFAREQDGPELIAIPEEGTHEVEFTSDSTFLRLSEVCHGRSTLTVREGRMWVHLVLAGRGILALYAGSAQEAAVDEEHWLRPAEEVVVHADGSREVVHAFDLPVSQLERELVVSLCGAKGIWYEHRARVSRPLAPIDR